MNMDSNHRALRPRNSRVQRALLPPYRVVSFVVFLTLLPSVGVPVLAQVLAAKDVSAPKTPEMPKRVQLKVHPAAAPRPALKYTLLPNLLDQTPGNAEPRYYVAAQLFADHAKEDFANKLSDWLGVSLGELPREDVREALDEQAPALQELRLATRREWCRWDLPIRSEGFNMVLPSLSRFRSLGRLLAVKARLEISEHRYDDALDTLQDGFAMAWHVGDAPNLIHSLVGAAIASMMADRVAELLQAPDAPNLYWALTELPRPFVDLRTGVQAETCLVYFTAPELRDLPRKIMTPGEVERLADKVFGLAGSASASGLGAAGWGDRLGSVAWTIKMYPPAKRHLLSLGRSPKDVDAMPAQQVVLLAALDHYDCWRDELFKWFALPYWQACEGMKEAETRFSRRIELEAYPFTALLPSLGGVYFTTTRLDRQIAAFRCIEAMRMHAAAHDGRLPASLAEIDVVPIPLDPMTGASFSYELAGETAALHAPAPVGRSAKDGIRYEITLTK